MTISMGSNPNIPQKSEMGDISTGVASTLKNRQQESKKKVNESKTKTMEHQKHGRVYSITKCQKSGGE